MHDNMLGRRGPLNFSVESVGNVRGDLTLPDANSSGDFGVREGILLLESGLVARARLELDGAD